ncbi:MAG: NAD(+) diphosphatase [Desulfuromonadales bacterium]|nr:NAD(+) diphosphatase [Desulfuromonadales bacterium]
MQAALYPEAVNLPFNFSSVKNDLQICAPGPVLPAEEGTWVIIQGSNAVLEETGNGLKLLQGKRPELLSPQGTVLCIGSWQHRPLFAATVSSSQALEAPLVAEPFNATHERMDIQTLTLAGLAKQILHWEFQSRHCQRCGGATERMPATWGKHCTACHAEHYPHIHPCAIVLVKRGNELLLVRKPEWAAGRYGLVAGFLDFGESLEECAIREVKEETGIAIRNVRYLGSQNWPFPAQLMAGFIADYDGGEICIETRELEDARWFPVDALPALPPLRSIARWIIDNFK